MNTFDTFYYNDPVNEVDVKNLAQAAGQKLGQSFLNLFRKGMKKVVFEPKKLKLLKPVVWKKYKEMMDKYADWKIQKTKIGQKKNIWIADIAEGVLGKLSGDDFINILSKYDPKVKSVNMDETELPPRITVYLMNNKGKLIFFDLPIEGTPTKRLYAIGIDDIGNKNFAMIHGMPFVDYIKSSEDDSDEYKSGTKQDIKQTAAKFKTVLINQDLFNQFMNVQKESIKLSFNDDLYETRSVYFNKDKNQFAIYKTDKKTFYPKIYQWAGNLKDDDILVDPTTGNEVKDSKEILDKYKNVEKASSIGKKIQQYVTDVNNVKKSNIVDSGKMYYLNNGGKFYVYKKTDGKLEIMYDEKASEILTKLNIVKKDEKEVEIPESKIINKIKV